MIRAEVFKLYEKFGECCAHLVHEFLHFNINTNHKYRKIHSNLHELCHYLSGYTFLSDTQIKRVIQELLRVGTEVEADRKRRCRTNAISDNNSLI